MQSLVPLEIHPASRHPVLVFGVVKQAPLVNLQLTQSPFVNGL